MDVVHAVGDVLVVDQFAEQRDRRLDAVDDELVEEIGSASCRERVS
jgi:hypothetical protein